MAYILNSTFALAQLAVVGISATDLANMTVDQKIGALNALAMAAAGAASQVVAPAELAIAGSAMGVQAKESALLDLQVAAAEKAAGTVTP